MSCGTKDECRFGDYIRNVANDLNPVYRQDGAASEIPFTNMECWCCQSLLLCMSKSEKNPDRLYFKCRTNDCRFFQWADEKPRGKVWKWLTMRCHPDQAVEQRNKPNDLRKPTQFPRKSPYESVPREQLIDTSEVDERWRNYVAKMQSKMRECVEKKAGRGRKPYEAYKNIAKFVSDGIHK